MTLRLSVGQTDNPEQLARIVCAADEHAEPRMREGTYPTALVHAAVRAWVADLLLPMMKHVGVYVAVVHPDQLRNEDAFGIEAACLDALLAYVAVLTRRTSVRVESVIAVRGCGLTSALQVSLELGVCPRTDVILLLDPDVMHF